jgi:hypothetical protein
MTAPAPTQRKLSFSDLAQHRRRLKFPTYDCPEAAHLKGSPVNVRMNIWMSLAA